MSRHLVRVLVGLVITLFFVGHAAHRYRVDFIERLDGILFDARLRLTMPGKGDARVVVLDIDEKSLAELGRWPWSRNLMARVLDRVFEHGAAVVGFDMVWAERDNSSGKPQLDALAQGALRDSTEFQAAYARLRAALDYDAQFAASIRNRPVVLGHYFSNESRARVNAIPPPVLTRAAFQGQHAPVSRWTGFTGNLAELAAAASGGGHINPVVDADGVVRRVPLLVEFGDAYYEAFSLALVRAWLALQPGTQGKPPIEPRFGAEGGVGLERLDVGPLQIPVDAHAAALVPYAGPRSSFAYLSVADVLAGRVKAEQLKDKLVLVGTSAPTLSDIRSTPVQNVYPGVEIHANLVAGMINGALKRQPGYMIGAEVLLLLAGGMALALLLPGMSALWASLGTLALAALVVLLDVVLWREAATVLPVAAFLLMTGTIYTMSMAYGYFAETRVRRQVAERFGQYVPPEVVERIVADPGRYSMAPKAAELTILFSDVRGFTGISEALRPEELREYINAYLTAMSAIIRVRHHGTLDKYIGDAIMAFWGAPMENPGHARAAVLAALDMQKECKVLNAMFESRGWPALRIGVGLNTGSVRVGDMGSEVRLAYTVMGDAVNVASRLEGRTKHYGVGILAGEAVRAAVHDVVFREVDRIRVKGKDAALTVFEPIGLAAEVPAPALDELGEWALCLRAYRARQWPEAAERLQRLRQASPADGLYQLYARRTADLRAAPPPEGWDGVTRFDEK